LQSDPWTDADTLNAAGLGAAAQVPGPHSPSFGPLSIMSGLAGAAYCN